MNLHGLKSAYGFVNKVLAFTDYVDPVELYAPFEYWGAPDELKIQICNGCGAAGWKYDVVPDNILGLNITTCCHIHDWMYHYGTDNEDKEEADRAMLNNLVRTINAKTRWAWLKRKRLAIAREYYEAVKLAGGPAFWSGKNKNGTEMKVGY